MLKAAIEPVFNELLGEGDELVTAELVDAELVDAELVDAEGA